MIVAVVALAVLAALQGTSLVLLVPWARTILSSERAAWDSALKERELREDTEDERDQWKARAVGAGEERDAALAENANLGRLLATTRAEFAGYIAKKQQTASGEEAITIMDDIIGRKLKV